MANSKFPESGMAAVLDLSGWNANVTKYLSDVERMNRADAASEAQSRRNTALLDRVGRSLGQTARAQAGATKATEAGAKAATSLSKSLLDVVKQSNAVPGNIKAAAVQVDGFAKLAASGAAKVTLLATAVTAVAAAFVALGIRGAAMPGVIEAFDVSARRAGTLAGTLRADLSRAARGTVTDMQLMRTANVALAGASEGVAQALGQGGLAGLMEIARVQARATGQNVDFLFDSLVSGIKRSSPMLIDNTGLVLKVGDANEEYARSIGKAVDQLTAEERQIALLNATLEAGRVAVESYGQGALQASERLAQMRTMITNFLDRAGIAVQPIFNAILAVGNAILESIIAPIQNYLIPLFYELSNAIFGPVLRAFEMFQQLGNQLFAPIAESMHRWLVLVVSVLRGVGQGLNWLVQQAQVYLAPFVNIIRTYIVEPIAKWLDPTMFARRGGNVIGALATGLMWGANTFVFPAVLQIAQMIANFLMGMSPPPEGPLSTIDRGAANVMRAWVEGFIGVPLDPVYRVAAEVDAALGSIGSMAGDAVRARLALLDAELQPYLDRLEILKAQVKSITDPLTKAKEAVQTRLNTAVKGFFSGLVSAEQVRSLDKQNEQLIRQLDLYESMTAEAEYQVAMMESRQAVERVLLGIQARRTDGDIAAANATTKAAKATERAANATGGGAAEIAPAGVPGIGGFAISDSAVGDFLGVSDDEIAAFWADMGGAFNEGMAEVPGFSEQMNLMALNTAKLSDRIDHIKNTEGFTVIANAFDSVFGEGSGIRRIFTDFEGWLGERWPAVFGENGIVSRLNLDSILGTFGRIFGGGLLNPATMPQALVAAGVEAFSGAGGGLRGIVSGFGSWFGAQFAPGGAIHDLLAGIDLSAVVDIFSGVFGIDTGSLLRGIGLFIEEIRRVFKNESGGSLFDALINVGRMLWNLIAAPIENVINSVLGAIWTFMKEAFAPINTAIAWVNEMVGEQLLSPLQLRASPIISLTAPQATSPLTGSSHFPGLASGGIFTGMARVHRGEQLVSAGDATAVFPARWVSAMEVLAASVSRITFTPPPTRYGQPVVTDGGGGGNTINNNFYGRTDEASVRRVMAQYAARG